MPTDFRIEAITRNSSDMSSGVKSSRDPSLSLDERLKLLYPMVNEEETPLPRCWSVKDKFNFIGLSHNFLRVIYKGYGKTHKDASSVRATHPIPASCGLYYFEVKIVSKGRDGYMGVGLSAQNVSMNRLPGWDKQSYGYHGDDGNSFCSSGTGQAYGPTFTTNDVIGCGLNLVENSCFYTKNGHHLGTAFTDMPPGLYPTVGLQTPGEIVDANFGQEPFVFDIEGEMQELRSRIHRHVENFPPAGKHGEWQLLLNKMISSYLVHHGYGATAEAFSKATGQEIEEEWSSIKNRQVIQKLILNGKVGEAIRMTDQFYPGFLQLQPALHFLLKVRQFVEMVGGNDDLVDEQDGCDFAASAAATANNGKPASSASLNEDSTEEATTSTTSNSSEDVNMITNGNNDSNQNETIDDSAHDDDDDVVQDEMEVDQPPLQPALNRDRLNKLLTFGRRLQAMLVELEAVRGIKNDTNTKMLQDAFALMAYPDPWTSPVGWQLEPSEREYVASALNSTLLESRGFASRPPVEVGLAHTKQLVKIMAKYDLGACAFANIDDLIK